jgi:ADP-L-glycero-D-manno-heptose 6-epimerase
MKILVTGASGFVGKNLSNYLLKNGYTTKFIDSEYLEDLSWKNSLKSRLDKIDPEFIFHVGACSNTLETNVQKMMEENYEATKVISEWANVNKRKLIYSSSAANYGINGEFPTSLYGWSKYVAEDYVIKSGGVALRYFNVYGPGEENKGLMASVIYQAYCKKKAGEQVFLYPGQPSRDFVYIDDVIAANIYAMKNYFDLNGKYYEVSTGHTRTFETVLDLAGIDYLYLDKSLIPSGYQFFTCGDPKRWMQGWTPLFSLEKGISEYIKVLNFQSNLTKK